VWVFVIRVKYDVSLFTEVYAIEDILLPVKHLLGVTLNNSSD